MSDERIELLQKAIELTGDDRNEDYGEPVENHEHIARIFNAITGHHLTAADVAMLHVSTKLARMRTSPFKADNYTDCMAYLGIAFECKERELDV